MLHRAGLKTDYIFNELLSKDIDTSQAIDPELLDKIDSIIIKNTMGRFNLNASLQSDRGFSMLNYEESLLAAQAIYRTWKHIFDQHHVDIIFHEPTSLFFNHLAAVMCKAQQGMFLSQSIVFSETDDISYINIIHDDYTCPEVERNVNFFNENPDKIDHKRCKAFIDQFRSNYEIFLPNIQPGTSPFVFSIKSLERRLSRFFNRRKYDRLKQNIDYWLNRQNPMGDRLRNLRAYKKYGIRFEEPVAGEKYYYYSFHLEPEAVVLYLGDGIYANQTKLIENIAASLPAGCYLYVKDHPHEFAYRCADDYLRLSRVPNIRLIRSSIPGKQLIKDAVGVFTINGTAGFEGVMLRKQVYCFGKSYYSDYEGVNYIHHIRDLRKTVYENQEKIFEDDTRFYAFVNGYLNSLHVGMVDFFMGRAETYGIDLDLNARRIADDLVHFSENYQP
jgi:hypothetical protein